MSLRLSDRLAASRRFVGRVAELELFAGALAANPSFAVLYLHGPGGIGKSALLQQYAQLARQAGRPTVALDCRDLDPSPQNFFHAFSAALGHAVALADLAQLDRLVLLLDTYETFVPLDGWLREQFLPQLAASALVVIAGRNAPGAAWRSDSAWGDLLRSVALRNLSPADSQTYLQARAVPQAQHAAVLGFTHGHPLALSLVADITGQSSKTIFQAEHAPDVVALLLERFVQEVPSAQHRFALHTCAVARVLTEPLLREALGVDDVQPIFAWLRSLSFIEQGPFGLFPHDLAREVLDSDLRWRDPERYAMLHQRLRDAIVQRVLHGQGADQARAVFDLIYLHRHNAVLQRYFEWQSFGTLYAEAARPADTPAILQRIADFAGEEAAELAEHWLARQPTAWFIVRDAQGEIAGIFMYLDVHLVSDADRARDAAVEHAWRYAQRYAPLRPGDAIAFARYYLSEKSYHQPTPVINTAQTATALRWMTNPRLVWSFNNLFDPDHWQAMMHYYDFHRLPDRSFNLFAHDWRQTPVLDWIAKVSKNELIGDLPLADLPAAVPLLALSQPEFDDAVRAALRDFHSRDALAANPLMRSRLVRDSTTASPTFEDLQRLLRQGAASMQDAPREAKFYRALFTTYFAAALTQEQAAERLGLPFNTYRYQLAQGIARLTAWLWQRELYGA